MSENCFARRTSPAAEETFNVYRLKANPTWIKFGPRAAPAEQVQHSASAPSASTNDRPLTSTYRGVSAKNNWSTASSSGRTSDRTKSRRETHLASSSASPHNRLKTTGADGLVDAGVDAALRHERHRLLLQQQQRSGRGESHASAASLSPTASVVKDTDCSSVSCVSGTSFTTTRRTILVDNKSTGNDGCSKTPLRESSIGSTHLPICEGHSAASSVFSNRTNSHHDHNYLEETSYSSDAGHISEEVLYNHSQESSKHSLCDPKPVAQAGLLSQARPSMSTARSSVSRATATHLSGSAAVVKVKDPLDSLYVPLRRPPPQSCEATCQHFSIFDVAGRGSLDLSSRGHVSGGGAKTHVPLQVRGDSVQRVLLSGGGGGENAWAPSSREAYQTSNSIYGRGW